MNFDITKISNAILYMLHKQVKFLNDKKLLIMIFLIDYNHQKYCGKKIFNDNYLKTKRHPEGEILSELFAIILDDEDLEEDDARGFLIEELLNYLDIEILKKEKFTELEFIKLEEEFDDELFSSSELKTMQKVINEQKNSTYRDISNATFQIDEVRNSKDGEIIF